MTIGVIHPGGMGAALTVALADAPVVLWASAGPLTIDRCVDNCPLTRSPCSARLSVFIQSFSLRWLTFP